LATVAFFATPNLDPPDGEDRVSSYGAHGFVVDVCAVEVDRATGAVTVTDYASVHDAGTLLNPMLAEGQVRGGFAHGVGAALFERHVYDGDGNLMTASLVDYVTPTAPDLPELVVDHLESPSPFTPLGAKGLGEGATMSAPVAIANAALRDANRGGGRARCGDGGAPAAAGARLGTSAGERRLTE